MTKLPVPQNEPHRASPVEVISSGGTLVDYDKALATMEQRVSDIHARTAPEALWLLEHPPLYTAGTSAKPQDLIAPDRFPVYNAGRGGQYTYHGPGQRVIYVMLDVKRRFGGDVRRFVKALEAAVIEVLAQFDIKGEIREGRVGVWVRMPHREETRTAQSPSTYANGSEAKIAAIGIRIRRGISFHGISINCDPDLTHFAGIVPCGIEEFGVTSIKQLQPSVTMADLDGAIDNVFLDCIERYALQPKKDASQT
ncbi:MAG: lipoyl(octanoyl) transferase LipB [Alphaproteobacteria bacterium]|nr:lipoyl(octanoyl) transferase LipB [Alphaproteobacteria bacterium]